MALSAAAEVDSPEGDFLTATAMSACVPTMSTFAGRFDLPPSSEMMKFNCEVKRQEHYFIANLVVR